MNTGRILVFLFLVSSCASDELKRFGTREHFQMKQIHLDGDVKTHISYPSIGYVASKENHCFESVDDREVYTVNSSNLKMAIQHFYFRTISYDVKKVHSNGNHYLVASTNEEKTVDLEVAYCAFERSNHWIRNLFFLDNLSGDYVSFRLVK